MADATGTALSVSVQVGMMTTISGRLITAKPVLGISDFKALNGALKSARYVCHFCQNARLLAKSRAKQSVSRRLTARYCWFLAAYIVDLHKRPDNRNVSDFDGLGIAVTNPWEPR